MKKIAVLLLGVIVLLLLAFIGTNYMTNNSAPPDYVSSSSGTSSTSTEETQSTESISTVPEVNSFLEGYYWEGYLDRREKISDLAAEKEYRDSLADSQIPGALEDTTHSWYRLEDVTTDVQNGSYARVTYDGPVLEVYPAIVKGITEVEIID